MLDPTGSNALYHHRVIDFGDGPATAGRGHTYKAPDGAATGGTCGGYLQKTQGKAGLMASTANTDRDRRAGSSIDPGEIARFSALAAEWWDPAGKFQPLHKFNPVRLAYIRERAVAHFGLDPKAVHPFESLRFLDIGCGGGLLSEPMARLGAPMVSADASEENIKTASVHAAEQGLDIDYRCTTAEALAQAGETFDVILNMEVIEHVADPMRFLADCAGMLKPGGLMFIATLNRTLKAHAFAIVGAEYVLGWLPRGTHDWKKFITVSEMEAGIARAGLTLRELTGVIYNPLTGKWWLGRDTDVNYLALAERTDGASRDKTGLRRNRGA